MRFSGMIACFLVGFLIGVAANGQLFRQDMGLSSRNGDVADASDPWPRTQPEYETINGTIFFAGELCLGRYWKVPYMGNDVGDEFSLFDLPISSVVPISSIVNSRLIWRHHVNSPAAETFTARAMNLGDQGLLARFQLIIHRPDACTAFLGRESFSLIPGVRTRLSFDYEPGGGAGRYCFVASLVYGVDANGNGVWTAMSR